jgi:cellulose synthase/poly-beta-1,6-N-acetylglucosamine synthase-like glycosyltransferase
MSVHLQSQSVSIIVPTFNAAGRIASCLEALCEQAAPWEVEILVVNDGSGDDTAEVVRRFQPVRLINQANAGPAAARNRGAFEARGAIIVFTDDDCVPAPGWLNAMLKPFDDPEVVATKGVYRTRQKALLARFVQSEYEDRYRLMKRSDSIDFVDTYSAAFRRNHFLEMNGFDPQFPLACAEDAELSYRMAARGWKMKFMPEAVVYHSHPQTLSEYLRKKYKFAFWRVVALRSNPRKALKDSHTPQLMKLQLLFIPALLAAAVVGLSDRLLVVFLTVVVLAFFLSTLPFVLRVLNKDSSVAFASPLLLAARSGAQLLGIAAGLTYSATKPVKVVTHSSAA